MIVYPGAKVEIFSGTIKEGYFQQWTNRGKDHHPCAIIIGTNNKPYVKNLSDIMFVEPDIYHSDYPNLEKRAIDHHFGTGRKPSMNDIYKTKCHRCGGQHMPGDWCDLGDKNDRD